MTWHFQFADPVRYLRILSYFHSLTAVCEFYLYLTVAIILVYLN